MANVDHSESAEAFEVALATTNTEYSFTFPAGCKRFRLQCRDATDVRVAFLTGKVAGSTSPYHTVKSGAVWEVDKLYFNKNVMYLAASGGSKVVEVLCFT
jgi:hypothetical protein